MTDMTAAPPGAAPPAPDASQGTTTTVCIACTTDAQGNMTYSVGIEPPEAPDTGAAPGPDDEAAEQSAMQPAKDVNDALRQAKALLDQPQSADGGPSPFESAFANARGTPDMGSTAGGLGQ